MDRIKVNLVTGAIFNGRIIAEALMKNEYDLKVYSSAQKKKWGSARTNLVFSPMPFKIMQHIFGQARNIKQREYDAEIFDYFASTIYRNCDVLHGLASFSLKSAIKQKKNKGIFILDRACPHALIQKELLEEEMEILETKNEILSKKMLNRMQKEYELADKIVVPSEYTKKSFIKMGMDEKKIIKIPLDSNLVGVRNQHLTKNKDKDIFVLGIMGGDVVRKGYYHLIKAWDKLKLKNAKLILRVSNSAIRKFNKICDLLDKNSNIEIIEKLDDAADFYKSCDVFCLPSIDDGFGMVVMESLSYGRPVITTYNTGSSEFIKNGYNGFVTNVRDVDQMAEVIIKLYEDRILLKQMKINAGISYEKFKRKNKPYEISIKELYESLI